MTFTLSMFGRGYVCTLGSVLEHLYVSVYYVFSLLSYTHVLIALGSSEGGEISSFVPKEKVSLSKNTETLFT